MNARSFASRSLWSVSTVAILLAARPPVARAEPARTAVKQEAARPAAPNRPAPAPKAQTDAPYGCHPGRDLSCTVIHETASGVVVVTFRPTRAKTAHAWSVVNVPERSGNEPAGGTIYIVPASQPAPQVSSSMMFSANESPIID
ncbi:MAG: hypothetical protein JWM82_1190 [Myxococcales bacterium]|nr:hypothetical protein [Myxococcales bacterium]